MTGNGRGAVFIDRDGTLIEEVGYLNHISRLRHLPRSAEAVRKINHSGMLAFLVTNQSGVARRIFDRDLVETVHEEIRRHLGSEGAHLDGVYYCPHHPDAADPRYREVCECRKPKPGMILRAVEEHGADLSRSYLVGDTVTDLEAARHAGITSVLVLTGYGRGELEYRIAHRKIHPAHVAEDLSAAVDWILARDGAARAGR